MNKNDDNKPTEKIQREQSQTNGEVTGTNTTSSAPFAIGIQNWTLK